VTTYFVSRHPGAMEWARRQQLRIDSFVLHLDAATVHCGDTVIGSLPVNLAALVCAQGAAYWHVSLELPAALRGHELSADDLVRLGARLQQYHIQADTEGEATP
jgi:CRISPR-associated protein Csx16